MRRSEREREREREREHIQRTIDNLQIIVTKLGTCQPETQSSLPVLLYHNFRCSRIVSLCFRPCLISVPFTGPSLLCTSCLKLYTQQADRKLDLIAHELLEFIKVQEERYFATHGLLLQGWVSWIHSSSHFAKKLDMNEILDCYCSQLCQRDYSQKLD